MWRRKVSLYFITSVAIYWISDLVSAHHHSALTSLQPPAGNWTPCGRVFGQGNFVCQCLGSFADCSNTGLSNVPIFRRSVTTLLFSHNSLYNVFLQVSVFMSNITHLDLSFNYVLFFPDLSILFPWWNVKVLDFSGNMLSQLFLSFNRSPALEELDISRDPLNLYPFSFELFETASLDIPKLRILVLNFFNFRKINMTAFRNLANLQELQIKGRKATNTDWYPNVMPNLKKLVLSNNSLTDIIYSCFDSATSGYPVYSSYFPKLTHLDLAGNIIGRAPRLLFFGQRCLPELRTLLLDSNMFVMIQTGDFSGDQLSYPKLQHLSLKAAVSSSVVNSHAFNNPSLLTLDLSLNGLNFASDTLNESAFDGCTNLIELNLEGNLLRDVPDSKFHRLFADITSLRFLNLGNTKMCRIGKVLWKSLIHLTALYLHENLITVVPEGAFDDLQHLTVIRLEGNHITTVSESTFSLQTLSQLTSLNLSQNPFECTCSLLWFRDRVMANPKLFEYDVHSRYECKNLPGTDLSSFMQNKQPCILGHDAYVFTVFCSVTLISILILVSQFYRYRWHIRLVLYEVFRGKPSARWQQRRPEDFRYDLFVSYDSEDECWITQHLMSELEEGMGLRLCVHQRDFIPGKNIVDNIVDSLEVSRRVLAVFSPSFAESHWCHFELEMCLSRVIYRNDVMVVVMLQHVPSRDMSGAMLALINTTTYIAWGDDPDVRDRFWRKMTLALRNVPPGHEH